MKYDVVIIGGGAAGLTAAYTIAKESKNNKILVIEKSSAVGKKLSASGNGKCNLTNSRFGKERYYSSDSDFVKAWTHAHTHQEILGFFEDMGVLLYEKDGYYYPYSNQAKQVTEALYRQCINMGVTFFLNTAVKQVEEKDHYYQIEMTSLDHKVVTAKQVIVSVGGAAAPKLGGTKDGITIAKKLGIHTTHIYPALTPAYITDMNIKIAKGVRQDVMVTLKEPSGATKKERGQLQINEDSLSGIAMMNLSCLFNAYQEEDRKDCLWIDLLPDCSWDSLKNFLLVQSQKQPQEELRFLLSGILPSKLSSYVLARTKIKETQRLNETSEKQINKITSLLKKMTFTPMMKTDYDKAQVCSGGVSVKEINWESFESLRYKGLYFVGEVLDMTGECGGYNLTFAILSGKAAAHNISR